MGGYTCGAFRLEDSELQYPKPSSSIPSQAGDRKIYPLNLGGAQADRNLRCFYFLIALNITSGLLYTLFYHPPTFHMKHRIRTKTQQVKMFDYIGAALFVAGLILFEIGFLWGGGVWVYRIAV